MTCDFAVNTNLVAGSMILIINFISEKENNKIKINIVEYLNLYNYIEYKKTGFNYKLIGAIILIEDGEMKGHFIAYCQHYNTNLWYKYNDDIVSGVYNYQNEINSMGTPYLLFYQKINN